MIQDDILLEMLQSATGPRTRKRWFDPEVIGEIVENAPKPKALELYRQQQPKLADAEKASRDDFLLKMLRAEEGDAKIAAPYRGAWAASLGSGPVDFKSAPQIKENQQREALARQLQSGAEAQARKDLEDETKLVSDEDKARGDIYEKALTSDQKSLYAGKTRPPDAGRFVSQEPKKDGPLADRQNSTDFLLNRHGFARETADAFDELSIVEKKDIRGALESESSSRRAFNEVIALASLVGKQAFPTDGKRKLMAKINELRAKARVSMGFGVLSDQEMKRLDSIIPDPSSIDVNTVSGAIEVFRELRDAGRMRLEDKMRANNISPAKKLMKGGRTIYVPESQWGAFGVAE